MKCCIALLVVIGSCGLFTTAQGEMGLFYRTAKNVTYFINQEYRYTWYEAFLECHSRNMSLFTMESDDEFKDLLSIIVGEKFVKKGPHLWIGGIGTNKKLVWVNTGKPIISEYWGKGNPDYSKNLENCVHIYETYNAMNDNKCTEKFGFICEMKKANHDKTVSCDVQKSDKNHPGKYGGLVFNFNQR